MFPEEMGPIALQEGTSSAGSTGISVDIEPQDALDLDDAVALRGAIDG